MKKLSLKTYPRATDCYIDDNDYIWFEGKVVGIIADYRPIGWLATSTETDTDKYFTKKSDAIRWVVA